MPIVISKEIPAYSALQSENIFVMSDERAFRQDIRPLEIAILNLMPTKVETETQFMRLLSNSPLQVNITLVYTESYKSKNTAAAHLEKFYKTFDEIKDKHFDGMIITGAPVETMPFEEVLYWDELKKIFDFADRNVTSTIYICWGAQAALYYHYGIQKYLLPEKLFGIFPHRKRLEQHDPLLKGVDDIFYIPHSRHTTVHLQDVEKITELIVLSESDETGLSIAKSKDNKKMRCALPGQVRRTCSIPTGSTTTSIRSRRFSFKVAFFRQVQYTISKMCRCCGALWGRTGFDCRCAEG